jgi:hypothetical protein
MISIYVIGDVNDLLISCTVGIRLRKLKALIPRSAIGRFRSTRRTFLT